MLQRVLERLMGTSVSVDNEEEPEQRSTNVNQKRVHCSLITLCNWYKTVTKVCSYCKEVRTIMMLLCTTVKCIDVDLTISASKL